jgi:hypothetical protein
MKALRSLVPALCVAAFAAPALGEEAFDACVVFTQADAEAALGTPASPEPVNPKVKRPKVVTTCTYTGLKDGKPVAATAQFRFGKSEGDVKGPFGEHRMQVQTKPILLSGSDAFWSAKTGQMNVRKDRTWVTLSVGPAKVAERDAEQARKLAELIVKKL